MARSGPGQIAPEVPVGSPRPAEPADAAEAAGGAAEAGRALPPSLDNAAVERGFRFYTTLICVVAVACVVAVSVWLPFEFTSATIWIVLGLLAAFAFAERCAINIDVRSGVSWSISFTEVPLVIGLVVADFEVVLVAHLIAGVGTLAGRKLSGRLPYNAGVMALEICAAFAVAHMVKELLAAGDIPWIAAFLGALSAPTTSTFLALITVWVLRKPMQLATGLRFMARVIVVGFVNASVGVSGYLVITHVEHGWALIGVVAAALAALYWAYSGLLREQRDLEALSDVSLMVSRSGKQVTVRPGGDGDEFEREFAAGDWIALAERIKDQLAARRVVLRFRLDGADSMHTVVAGEPLPSSGGLRPGDPMLRLHGSHARRFSSTEAGAEVSEALRLRGVEELLVVPLRSGSQLLGLIEAHDRRSRWRGFGKSDVQLIGMMAAHLATALDNRRLMATLRHDAYHDPLTGLLNRPGFAQAARVPLAAGEPTVVVRVELDEFSTVCDALGYAWADRMVVIAGRRLRDVLGGSVPAARLEGASFAVLVNCEQGEARDAAERIRAELSVPYPIDRLTVEASALVGYASSEVEDSATRMDIDGLLQRADVAVRAITNADEVRGYVPSMGQIFMRRFQLVTQFRQALEAGQVSVHYQPKISLERKTVLGVEALVRWNHPEFGKVHPDEFVPAIEAAGLIGALTSFVLDAALVRVRKWLDEGLRISAAVNLSVRSLADADFPSQVVAALRHHNVPPELLTFELTESGVMADPERALPILRELHNLGVVLAVDDFGTGYSSLAYLRQLPVDEVKIDKSFVFGMGTDLGDLAVVRSIVELGHSLGLTVVAEGVEEDLARDQLEAMGCDVAQGYLISRPLSEKRLEAWLQARTARAMGRKAETVLTLLT
ncbi:MAG: EAL domain-containing protein [Actinophytocola sp.]|nr:EAL domain-containing protein [Actinophytocola sp.]